MPILGILGTIWGLASVFTFGWSVYDIISTGEWRDWSLFDWIVNIGFQLFLLWPIFKGVKAAGTAVSAAGGTLSRLLEKVPLLGKIATWIWAIKTAFKTFYDLYLMKWFTKGGILYELGNAARGLLNLVRKHPILFVALMLLSSVADGVFSHIYQLWGDLTMRAANAAFEAVSAAMDRNGYTNPIYEAIDILSGSKSTLPACFTAIWGAVGASECIGMIITTFQYIALLKSMQLGYRLYGKNGV